MSGLPLPLATIEPEGFNVALYKQIGLVIFFGIFAGIGLWLLLTRRSRFDKVSRIPLDDDGSDSETPTRGEHG